MRVRVFGWINGVDFVTGYFEWISGICFGTSRYFVCENKNYIDI